jgi:hypothetical protein
MKNIYLFTLNLCIVIYGSITYSMMLFKFYSYKYPQFTNLTPILIMLWIICYSANKMLESYFN